MCIMLNNYHLVVEEKYQSTENMGEPKSKRESKYRSEYNILGRCLPWGETISKLKHPDLEAK